MPSPRRRTIGRRERFTELTRGIKRILLTGSDFFEKPNIETLREAWQEHGPDLLDDWIARHPCTRPFACWLFDIVPTHGERETTPEWGKCEPWRSRWLKHGILHTHCHPPMQETECEFLERNGLLTEDEVFALVENPELRDSSPFDQLDTESR